ncbi:MAG TPA: MurR/RpiR family transcriptional regulator [Acidobacteriaceae bacterium]|nr:MurR/RpiR family transcriptional regulator [Acidobacteriaceae bacterium]
MVRKKSQEPLLEHRESLAQRMAELSPKRRETIRPALEHPRNFVLLNVRDMATRLDSDPATIVRIARGMHFASYKAFQQYLHELSIANATSFDTMQAGPKDSSVTGTIRESLDNDLRNLNALRNSLDLARIARLARRVYAAKRILLFGGDLAESLVQYFHYHLLVLGLPVQIATTSGHTAYVSLSASRKDMMFAISFRRGLRQTVEGMQRAKRAGAYCVGITDTYLSPIAQQADEFFLASVETHSFGASYVAPLALINAILTGCANCNRTRTLKVLRQAEDEQKRGFRWFGE